ncbi:hypothetical protein [Mycobacterium colombiense]|uniref:Uncharacterized protein n=1 Tax=Mycobacterium colombiense TaxID=339268 RepID=A0A1A2Z7N3_9MYCO|nr:hypothetical protein [Mycobacterium colombiense]OBI46609.1 hypothetical protein A5708_13335 [Mycobacterium colombiense]
MAANDTSQPVSPARSDDLRVTLALSRDKLVRQRVDVLAQIRTLSGQLESIDRQLEHIAHIEAAHVEP